MVVIMVVDMSANKILSSIMYQVYVADNVIQSYPVTKGYSKLWGYFCQTFFFSTVQRKFTFLGNMFQKININIKM